MFFLMMGSSKSGTTLHGAVGKGKFHSSLEVGKTSERPLGQIVSLNFVAHCSLLQGFDVVESKLDLQQVTYLPCTA